jgi:hypothetical protein
MNLTMVSPTQRHGEFVARLATQRPDLREPEVVGI